MATTGYCWQVSAQLKGGGDGDTELQQATAGKSATQEVVLEPWTVATLGYYRQLLATQQHIGVVVLEKLATLGYNRQLLATQHT